MFKFHKCEQNEDYIRIIELDYGILELCIPFDCGDPQDSCTNDIEIICCPFCEYKSNQPERSKREDSQKCEMRCSEHCRNAVRDK